jgi:threonine synthase
LVAVQAEPYTPLYEAFHGSMDKIVSSPRLERISADGIAINTPVRSKALLAALRRSQGTVVAATEEEVQRYHERLAQRGLFVEPTSAVVGVALDKVRDLFQPEESVVAVLTGHGLKHPPKID